MSLVRTRNLHGIYPGPIHLIDVHQVTYSCFKAMIWPAKRTGTGVQRPRCICLRESFSVARPDVVGVRYIHIIAIYDPRTVYDPVRQIDDAH